MNTAVGVLIVTFVFIGLVDHGPVNLLRRAGLVLIRWAESIQARHDSVSAVLDKKESSEVYLDTSVMHFKMDAAMGYDWNDPNRGCACSCCVRAREWFQISRNGDGLRVSFRVDSPGAEDSLEQARRSA